MSKLETNTIDTVSGTNTLTIGSTNTSTIDFSNPANVTLNAAMKNQHLFVAGLSTSTTLTDNTTTKIIYDNEIIDLSNAYDVSNSKFVAPEAGYYHFWAALRVGTPLNPGRFDLSFYKNGTAEGCFGGLNQQNSNNASTYGGIVLNLAVNDEIEVKADHNFGNSQGTVDTNNAQGKMTGFMGYKLIT